ncbi:hypothetical protein P9366_21985, partial [Escherichia coli]|uniref:hypothetical protein n=1 Tax=Escherichia coli TaxID=562 RepID=UPI00389206C8
ADRNRSHWSTSKTPSYTKSVSWQHHQTLRRIAISCDLDIGSTTSLLLHLLKRVFAKTFYVAK